MKTLFRYTKYKCNVNLMVTNDRDTNLRFMVLLNKEADRKHLKSSLDYSTGYMFMEAFNIVLEN